MTAAGVCSVACGVECLAGRGPVAVPSGADSFVLVVGPEAELVASQLEDELSLVAAVLVDAGMREIPYGCFDGTDSLVLVALPVECTVICEEAFARCGALAELNLENVEVLEKYAVECCYHLSHVGTHSRVRSVGNFAFLGVAIAEFAFGSLSRIGVCAFLGSDVKVFSSHVDEWGRDPFENCRGLQRLELWPGRGFDPIGLVGHVPGHILFHGSAREGWDLFSIVLDRSREHKPLVQTTDEGTIFYSQSLYLGGPANDGRRLRAFPIPPKR
jgi:hypothetical protein